MLTLRGISSTVFTVRLDTKCCNIMFAAIDHDLVQVVRKRFQTVRGRFATEQGQSAGPRRVGRSAAAGRRWLTPLGSG